MCFFIDNILIFSFRSGEDEHDDVNSDVISLLTSSRSLPAFDEVWELMKSRPWTAPLEVARPYYDMTLSRLVYPDEK